MAGTLSAHSGKDGHSGGARADNHSFFVLEIQILGPELWMHYLTREVLEARNLSFKTLGEISYSSMGKLL